MIRWVLFLLSITFVWPLGAEPRPGRPKIPVTAHKKAGDGSEISQFRRHHEKSVSSRKEKLKDANPYQKEKAKVWESYYAGIYAKRLSFLENVKALPEPERAQRISEFNKKEMEELRAFREQLKSRRWEIPQDTSPSNSPLKKP